MRRLNWSATPLAHRPSASSPTSWNTARRKSAPAPRKRSSRTCIKDWIHTVSTFSGVNNGTTLASFLRKNGVLIINDIYLAVNTMLGDSAFNEKIIDFHMEQWGVQTNPEKLQKTHLRLPTAKWKEIQNYNKNVRNSVGFEMQIEGMYDINEWLDINPNCYYFAHAGGNSSPTGKGYSKMNKDASILAKIVGQITGKFTSVRLQRYGYSKPEWDRHDGFVNTESAKHPLDEPFEVYEPGMKLVPGKWYDLPVEERMDHVSYMGMGMDEDEYLAYFDNFVSFLSEVPD